MELAEFSKRLLEDINVNSYPYQFFNLFLDTLTLNKITEEKPTSKTFRHYMFFFSGQLVSILGSSIVQFVITWWITIETESPVLISISVFLGTLPMVVLTPIAGVFTDRWNKKLAILIADSLQALITFWLIIVFIFAASNIWAIILINGLRGLFQAFHFPTVNALIPIMVPKEKLSRINGINYIFTGLIQVIGPGIAGTLLTLFVINQILWIDIITFFIALVPLLSISIPQLEKGEEEQKEFSFKRDFNEGIAVLKTTPLLLILIVLTTFKNFLKMPFNTLIPFYVEIFHSGNALDLALVMALYQGGLFFGALLTTIKKKWKHMQLIILIGFILGDIGYIIVTFTPIGLFLMIGIGAFILGAMIPVVNVMLLTLIQTQIPPDKQGRVISILVSIASAIVPVGTIISGPLAEIIGIINLYFFSAILGFIAEFIAIAYLKKNHLLTIVDSSE